MDNVNFKAHIDKVAGSSRYSVQIDDHFNKKTTILDDTFESIEEADKEAQIALWNLYVDTFARFDTMSMSCSTKAL